LRIVDAYVRGAGFEYSHEIQMRQRSAAKVREVTLCQVVRLNPMIILSNEPFGLRDFFLRHRVAEQCHDVFYDFRVSLFCVR
jgi:ABC-type taurine transport system ATPase subunit